MNQPTLGGSIQTLFCATVSMSSLKCSYATVNLVQHLKHSARGSLRRAISRGVGVSAGATASGRGASRQLI